MHQIALILAAFAAGYAPGSADKEGKMTPPLPAPEASRLLTGTPDDFITSCRTDMDRARAAIFRLKSLATPREPLTALELYDQAVSALGDSMARAGLCREVHPSEAMRKAADQCEQEIDTLSTELSLDKGVYEAVGGLDLTQQDFATKYWIEKTLRDFRRAGVDRDDATRGKVKELREELVKVGQEFGKNIREDVRKVELDPKDLDGLPEDFKRTHAPGKNGKVTLTTDNTDYVPFTTYAKSSKAREQLWRQYRLRGHPKNLDALGRMLTKRHELATLLGYTSWAAYVTEDKMIGSDKNAADFIAKITEASDARMKGDYEALLEQKRKGDPKAAQIDGWDAGFLQERLKAAKYGYEQQAVRPYFEYGRVKQGLMELTGKMFGIAYRRVATAKVWHPDVEAYDVVEVKPAATASLEPSVGKKDEKVLGRIYLDMFPRAGKYKHYAQFTLVNGVEGKRLPEGVLVCNFQRPTTAAAVVAEKPGKGAKKGKKVAKGAKAAKAVAAAPEPALLEHGDVETYFHEFGHLLHHILGGHTRWAATSGVATEHDFVEAPSQMLEEWVWDASVLQTFARHYKTGEAIPADLVKRMKAADEFGKGLWVRQQMFYAATSLEFHRRDPVGLDTTKVMAELQERYTPFKYVPETYFHESFGHLDGYSAVYYTYMWSLVIAKDLFSVFKKDGLLNPAAAQKYRKAVLEPGGSKPAAELVKDFLGRPYEFKAYEAWLSQSST